MEANGQTLRYQGASGVSSGFFDMFPKDENRETEVSGFRFFVSGWRGGTKKLT
jgi:hypothetical protein